MSNLIQKHIPTFLFKTNERQRCRGLPTLNRVNCADNVRSTAQQKDKPTKCLMKCLWNVQTGHKWINCHIRPSRSLIIIVFILFFYFFGGGVYLLVRKLARVFVQEALGGWGSWDLGPRVHACHTFVCNKLRRVKADNTLLTKQPFVSTVAYLAVNRHRDQWR